MSTGKLSGNSWSDYLSKNSTRLSRILGALYTFADAETTFRKISDEGFALEKQGDKTNDDALYKEAIKLYELAYEGSGDVHYIPALLLMTSLIVRLAKRYKIYDDTKDTKTDYKAQIESRKLFESAIKKLEDFIGEANKPESSFAYYKNKTNDYARVLNALAILKKAGLIFEYDGVEPFVLIHPDYKKAYELTLEAYALDNNIYLLHNLASTCYDYYLEKIEKGSPPEETIPMLEEIKGYLIKFLDEIEKVSNPDIDRRDDAKKLLHELQDEEKRSSADEANEPGAGWGNLDPCSLGGKSRKRISRTQKSRKRKRKTYKRTRRNHRKTKSYYKK
jgi:hypothetical protein